MYDQERNVEPRAVPQERTTQSNVTPMPTSTTMEPSMRGAPSLFSRISWGSVLAGVLVAIAAQLLLSALGAWIGYGTAAVTSVTELSNVSTAVGTWTAISALIALFIGGFVASRLVNARLSSDGLWHGLTVWAVTIVASIMLGVLGVSGLLGFASNAAGALRGLITTGVSISPSDLNTAANVAARTAGYFLLGSLLGLATALLGGWIGSDRMSRDEAMTDMTTRERMAA